MKKYSFIIALGMLLLIFFSCEEEKREKEMGVWDSGPITEYTVTPISGGAIIDYTIPNDPNIKYIMAEFERNGEFFTEKSSVYKNSLTIEGFHKVDVAKAKIYKVNKNEQKSQPISIEFEPLESVITVAQNSLNVKPGFGGVIASWLNPEETELGVNVLVEDSTDNYKLVVKDVFYSAQKQELHPFRDFETKETNLAIIIEDKWGNMSDTMKYTMTPLFETMIPKPYADFRSSIPYDNTSDLGAPRVMPALWDNIVNQSGHGWLTKPGNSGLSMTFDMKQVAQLSRIVIHGYHINSIYGQANITAFELWGIDKIDYDKLSDLPYWLDEFSVRGEHIHGVPPSTVLPDKTFKDDWEYLGYHEMERQKDVDAETQRYRAENGTEYTMPIGVKPVRYLRMFIREIAQSYPSSQNYWSMGEITFYGDNTMNPK
ncbi:MAG: DUF4959 domain-containing protein [Dysgonamonadaceae bacterium]|nr:DUF4959 domain-containing protein [Dysgonamonadaceae bacterium]